MPYSLSANALIIAVDCAAPDRARTYCFGPCAVSTQLILETLPAWSQADKALSIKVVHGDQHPIIGIDWSYDWVDADETTLSLARDRDGERYWLRVPDQADFLLDPVHHQIQCAPLSTALDDATLEHLLVDQILPRYLAHEGYVALHAAMLQLNGRTVLVTGPSGWGKSTLAGLVAASGHTLLSDDCTLLELADDHVRATPTYPSLRLWPDSMDALFPEGADARPMASYSDKQRVHGTATRMDEQDVSALIMLGDPGEAPAYPVLPPIRAAEACLALVRHSFQLDPGDKPRMATHLRTCSEIARRVPAFRFDYRRDYGEAGTILAALESFAATLPVLATRDPR